MDQLMTPIEQATLSVIKEQWEQSHTKLSITEIKDILNKRKLYTNELSFERVRLVIDSLWRSGELLIDVQGRERLVRPNHVTINSKTEPLSVRNFTIVDENNVPSQRIWTSIYADQKGRKYVTLSESRWNGSWKTTSNIIIPPDGVEQFFEVIKFLKKNVESDTHS